MNQTAGNGQFSENTDDSVRQISEALADYRRAHANASVEVRRENPVAIRVRIIDPDFRGRDRIDREPEVWTLLERLPDDVLGELTMLLLLTPDEASKSFASYEFDHPIPSRT